MSETKCEFQNMKSLTHSSFLSRCRPYNWAFWGSLVIPFGLIYILNWVLFIIIFTSLCRKNIKDDKMSARTKMKQLLIIAVMLSLLFGLGWGLGFVITSSIPVAGLAVTLQVIFILLSSFQGLLVFIMHCLRSKDVRDEWLRWINVLTGKKFDLGQDKKQSLTSGYRPNQHKILTSSKDATLTSSTVGTLTSLVYSGPVKQEAGDLAFNQEMVTTTTFTNNFIA